jgi:hypothetical protein
VKENILASSIGGNEAVRNLHPGNRPGKSLWMGGAVRYFVANPDTGLVFPVLRSPPVAVTTACRYILGYETLGLMCLGYVDWMRMVRVVDLMERRAVA